MGPRPTSVVARPRESWESAAGGAWARYRPPSCRVFPHWLSHHARRLAPHTWPTCANPPPHTHINICPHFFPLQVGMYVWSWIKIEDLGNFINRSFTAFYNSVSIRNTLITLLIDTKTTCFIIKMSKILVRMTVMHDLELPSISENKYLGLTILWWRMCSLWLAQLQLYRAARTQRSVGPVEGVLKNIYEQLLTL